MGHPGNRASGSLQWTSKDAWSRRRPLGQQTLGRTTGDVSPCKRARIAEAPRISGLTPRHLRDLVQRRQVLHFRVGRVVLVDLDDLERLIEAGRCEARR